eukprot:1030141-Amphidinium_carterae.1
MATISASRLVCSRRTATWDIAVRSTDSVVAMLQGPTGQTIRSSDAALITNQTTNNIKTGTDMVQTSTKTLTCIK